jgi:hypothetical protein
VKNIFITQEDGGDEPSFGIEEGEFWNTLATLAGRTLNDHTRAIRLFEIAERHAQVTRGRFRAFVGLTREYKDINDEANYRRCLATATGQAKAYQHHIIEELRAL